MKKTITLGVFILIFFGGWLHARADEGGTPLEPHKNSVVLGFDFGLGASHFSLGDDELNTVSGLKAGGGVREDLLLLFELAGTTGLDDFSHMQGYLFSVQYFPLQEGFYARGGFGLGRVREKRLVGSRKNYGLATATAIGYEWRMKRKFAISPELKLGYVRAGGNNYSYGFAADFRWYF